MKLTVALLMLLTCTVPSGAAPMIECWYFPKGEDAEVRAASCLRMASEKEPAKEPADAVVARKVARALDFGDDGIGVVRSGSLFFYVNRSRVARATVNYDNGPDPFSDGLARMRRDGKTGYFDKTLRVVVEPQYDFGFPFEEGLALVCNGCVEKPVGEHGIVTGGVWGAIDRAGKVIHPIRFEADELRRMIAGE